LTPIAKVFVYFQNVSDAVMQASCSCSYNKQCNTCIFDAQVQTALAALILPVNSTNVAIQQYTVYHDFPEDLPNDYYAASTLNFDEVRVDFVVYAASGTSVSTAKSAVVSAFNNMCAPKSSTLVSTLAAAGVVGITNVHDLKQIC